MLGHHRHVLLQRLLPPDRLSELDALARISGRHRRQALRGAGNLRRAQDRRERPKSALRHHAYAALAKSAERDIGRQRAEDPGAGPRTRCDLDEM